MAAGLIHTASSILIPSGGVGPDAEPTFNAATQTMILDDNMEEYTTVEAMGDTSVLGTFTRIVPNPSPVTGPPDDPVVHPELNQIIAPGRNGTGQALRLAFTGVAQDSAKWVMLNTPTIPDLATHYAEYYGRVILSAPLDPGVSLAVKWFMAWHKASSTRVEWNTRFASIAYRAGDPNDTVWQVIDQADSDTNGDQPVGPYPLTVFNGQWHKFSYSWRANTSVGSRDGFARMWVDGTKIVDVSATAAAEPVPPGGTHVWCTLADVDNLLAGDGFRELNWGWTQTTDTPSWTYDIDDVKWWIDGGLT